MTIPFGVLVGILIGLGRMSTDGEITAMRAAGVPSQKVILPVMSFALLATIVAGASSIWLTPAAIREVVRLANRLIAEQLTAEIQPRVFAEQFPNKILYVENVKTGPVVQWQNLFIADLTPPEQRQSGMREKADGPQITVAREAIAVPDAKNNRIQLTQVSRARGQLSLQERPAARGSHGRKRSLRASQCRWRYFAVSSNRRRA